jgi:hypothetical protein
MNDLVASSREINLSQRTRPCVLHARRALAAMRLAARDAHHISISECDVKKLRRRRKRPCHSNFTFLLDTSSG